MAGRIYFRRSSFNGYPASMKDEMWYRSSFHPSSFILNPSSLFQRGIARLEEIANPELYMERMAKSLYDKLRVLRYIPADTTAVLDVGCADGALTLAMAHTFPSIQFLGIDLNDEFIHRARAQARTAGVPNIAFERVYLRDLLARVERWDVITFCSVLHEFYTYGEGISSVMKAMADAHELLRPGGRIIIRDMILGAYAGTATLRCDSIAEKVRRRGDAGILADFVRVYGPLTALSPVNHYLLKYLYTDNWQHELREYYVAVTFEQYEQMFHLLGMTLQQRESYLLDFLRDKWRADLELDDDELAVLRSTGLLVAQKE